MIKVIMIGGVPCIYTTTGSEKESTSQNKIADSDLNKLITIKSPYDGKNVFIYPREYKQPESHFVWNHDMNRIFRAVCTHTGIDIITNEKWVKLSYGWNKEWYKEYTMKYKDETNISRYYNRYTDTMETVEYHNTEKSLLSAKGFDGVRISITSNIIGKDVRTGVPMTLAYGNWYEILDDATRDPAKKDKFPSKVMYFNIYDDKIRMITNCIYLEKPIKVKVLLSQNDEEVVCSPEYLGRDQDTGNYMAYFNGYWYQVSKSEKALINSIQKDYQKICEMGDRIKPIVEKPEGKSTFVNPYNHKAITITYIKYTKGKFLTVYDYTSNKVTIKKIIPEKIGWDENGIEWALYENTWYMVYLTSCEEKPKDTSNNEVVAQAKVQKVDTTDKNERAWITNSISNLESKKYVFPVNSIIANMAKFIYFQDPVNPNSGYPVHGSYISTILHRMYLAMTKDAQNLRADPNNDFYYFEYTKEELRKYLTDLVYEKPLTKTLFLKLNLSFNEIQKGIDINDSDREILSLSTRYSGPKWDEDFIDLDALIKNVVLECVRDSEAAK